MNKYKDPSYKKKWYLFDCWKEQLNRNIREQRKPDLIVGEVYFWKNMWSKTGNNNNHYCIVLEEPQINTCILYTCLVFDIKEARLARAYCEDLYPVIKNK